MSYGPCMCGDTHCSSCGPAQGNWQCPICRAWADDGCEHFESYCATCGTTDVDDSENGNETCAAHGHDITIRLRPEFTEQVAKIEADQREADNRYAADMIEEERLAEEYWRNQK